MTPKTRLSISEWAQQSDPLEWERMTGWADLPAKLTIPEASRSKIWLSKTQFTREGRDE